jgi:hypothetical protein
VNNLNKIYKINNDMKRIFLIEESLNEFAKRGKDSKIKKMRDIYTSEDFADDAGEIIKPEEEFDADEVDLDDIKDTDIFDKVDTSDMEKEDEIIIPEPIGYELNDDEKEEIKLTLRNELLIPDIDREPFVFSLKNDPEHNIVEGIPMAELSDGKAFLFKKEDGGLIKIYVKDIDVEE